MMKGYIINKYHRKMPGGVEIAFGIQHDGLKGSRPISYSDDDFGQFKFKKWRFSLQSIIKVCSLLWKTHADYVIINHPSPILGEIAFCISKLRKFNLVSVYHAPVINLGLLGAVYGKLMNYMVKKSKICVVSSNNLKTNLDIENSRCKVIPFTISSEFSDAVMSNKIRKIRKSASKRKTVGYFGRVSGYKNLGLIEALSQSMPDCDFKVLGPKDDESYSFPSVQANNLTVEIRHVDEDEKLAFLQSLDVFILPSISASETFGIVQLEALSVGCKLLRFDNGTGVTSIASNCQFAGNISENRVQNWKRELQRLLLLDQSKKDIMNFFNQNYGRETVLSQWKKLIDEI